MYKPFKTLFTLFLGILFFIPTHAANSEKLSETKTVLEHVEELGTFEKPTRYPKSMEKMFNSGCKVFSCRQRVATQKMAEIFNRKPIYFERYPGAQLHGMAMFELFYQQRLKADQRKIEKFINSWPDKKKYKRSIISLMKLNVARKKMRTALGMDLKINVEEAIESFWLMGDFLEQSEIKKRNIDKGIEKRIELLNKYREIVNTLHSEIRIKRREEFYKKIAKKRWKFGEKNLDDKFKDFVEDINDIKKEFSSLYTNNLHAVKIIDESVREFEKVIKFVGQSFDKKDIEGVSMTLSFVDKSISDIIKLAPQSNYNDMSNIDISNLGDDAFVKMTKITSNIQSKKNKDLTTLIQDLTKIHKKGLNPFPIVRNLKNLGVETLSFENILKAIKVSSSVEKDLNLTDFDKIDLLPTKFTTKIEKNHLLNEQINFIKEYMSKLGYSETEVKKEVEAIKLIKLDSTNDQVNWIDNYMKIGGASDEEIQKEINVWYAININNLREEAYLVALHMKANGISSEKIQKKVEIINAVELKREADELLVKIEDEIKKKHDTTNFSSKISDKEVLIFAQASKNKILDSDFETETNELLFNQFFPEKTLEQSKSLAGGITEKYKKIRTPLTIISVLISPNPYNIYQLTRRIKEHVDDGKARVLTVSTFATTAGEDELGGGDYVDPKIFERTAKIIMNLPGKNIESQYLAKKLSYSIILITTEAEKYDIPEQPDDKDKIVCPKGKCPKVYIAGDSSKSKNELKVVDNFFNQAKSSERIDIVEKMERMIKDKNITAEAAAEFITLVSLDIIDQAQIAKIASEATDAVRQMDMSTIVKNADVAKIMNAMSDAEVYKLIESAVLSTQEVKEYIKDGENAPILPCGSSDCDMEDFRGQCRIDCEKE